MLCAKNGKEGIKLARNAKPDLILCDISMPELDGYSVLSALNNIQERVGIPFVFMTAHTEKADFRKAMDLGADDYLTKPFDADTLLRIVSMRLKKFEKTKKNSEQKTSPFHLKENEDNLNLDMTFFSNTKTIKKLKKNAHLFSEGDSANLLYQVKSGKIKTSKSNDFGKEFIMNIYKEGDFLGYFDLLEDNVHKVSAIAIENSEVAAIPKQEFYNILYADNNVTMKFVKMMSRQLAETEDKLLKLAYDSARKRVAEALIFVSKKYIISGNNELAFNLLRENISALSGISPESVSRNLSCFRDEGLIETHNGSIKIKDLKKLGSVKN